MPWLGEEQVMNWISNVVRPKIRSFLNRREPPENLWIKCPETGQLVFYKDVEANQFVIPGSDYHMRMAAVARLRAIFDEGAWDDIAIPDVPVDPLRFRDVSLAPPGGELLLQSEAVPADRNPL